MPPTAARNIPDIYISRTYDAGDPDCDVHCETFSRMAEIFGRNTPAHRHSRFYQVHLLTRGKIQLHLDDQVYCGDAPLAFLTPPAVPHAFYSEEDTDGHVITVRQEVVRGWHASTAGLWPEAQLRDPAFMLLGNTDAALKPEIERLFALAALMRDEFVARGQGRSAVLNALGLCFFVSFNRLLQAELPASPLKMKRGEDVRIFLGFCDLVEAHFREHITLSEYARELAVTEARLNDVCRRIANLASKEVVHDRLLQEARRLLRFSSTPVGEISDQLGFADPAYFSRFFAQRTGNSPSQFRQQHHSGTAG
ncbi:MAG: 4-hydroxyphenylacetate catabolism regulatory protein HpaA [Zoogloea sp.]|jgi:AraC family 4-hydroxyphenylacetate 3-monooxygenase operon regulatory protein|nr:4-hydroxyphenylacetate catabolism regulatory protein HpaA [Zoogloea sp.]